MTMTRSAARQPQDGSAMTTMVCFSAAGTEYCIPVDATRAVRLVTEMISLPGARPDVAGLIPGDPPLTVISPLGRGGGQILVVETGEKLFGLLVDTVTGLRRVDDADIRPAPGGQDRGLISGTIESVSGLLLVASPGAMAAEL